VETVRQVGEANGRPDLAVSRVVPTLYRKTALAEAILGKLGEYFPGLVTEPVGFNVKIDEAQSHGQTIWEYAPKSKGAELLAQVSARIWDEGAQAGGQAVA
jgi:chromosome partitioning protein